MLTRSKTWRRNLFETTTLIQVPSVFRAWGTCQRIPLIFVGKRFTSDDFRVFVANVDFSAWKPKFVVVGNSSVPTIADWHKISSDVRIKDLISYFRDHMGWRSGPHLVIDDEATWIFGDLARPGVYAPSWNDSAI